MPRQFDLYSSINMGNIIHIKPGQLHVSQLGKFNSSETVRKLIIKIDDDFYENDFKLTTDNLGFFTKAVKEELARAHG